MSNDKPDLKVSGVCLKALDELEKVEKIELEFTVAEARSELNDISGRLVVHMRGSKLTH